MAQYEEYEDDVKIIADGHSHRVDLMSLREHCQVKTHSRRRV